MSATLSLSDAAARWLEDKLPELEAVLAPLVETNSFTGNAEGGNRTGALLKEAFAIPGLEVKSIPSTRFADHLVFSSRGVGGVAPVALVGHLDTVFPPGNFEGYRVDGALRRGPGVLDMKGGLVVIAWALRALVAVSEKGLASLPPLRIVIVSDEEIGSPEGHALIQEHTRGAQAALVFESGRAQDAIITRRKGTGAVTAKASGKAAHAGNAHAEGANAIWALSRFVDRVQRLTDYEQGITVNVGKISGGLGKNTVPDEAEALVDLRFCTRGDADKVLEGFRAAAAAAAEEVPGTTVEIEGGVARLPLERTEANVKLMEAYGACAHASGLGHSEAGLIGGGSDASTTAELGIPSIDGLGPRGKGFHTKDEHIEAATLVSKAQALARYLASVR